MTSCCWKTRFTCRSHLHGLVEDAAADLHHLQVLLLLIPGALDVGHPAALILLAGIDEITHRAVFVEHLSAHDKKNDGKSEDCICIRQHICPDSRFLERRKSSYLPHEVVILQQVHVFRGQDSPRKRAHLGSCFDPGF